MTASDVPTSSVSNPRSRRALLAGVLGGLGAWAATAIGRASPVRGADGEYVQVGGGYTATSETWIQNQSNSHAVIRAESLGNGIGVLGSSVNSTGVWANSDEGIGLLGTSSGTAVWGNSFGSTGVLGTTDVGHGVVGQSESGSGVRDISESGTGVYAVSNGGLGVRAQSFAHSAASIYGLKENPGNAIWGVIQNTGSGWAATVGSHNGSGPGVLGENTGSGHGTWGRAASGFGVKAESTGGLGLHAQSFAHSAASIYGLKQNAGNAVWGVIQDTGSGWAATVGSHNGSGPGVLGENTGSGHGTWGRALGSGGAGIFGESTNGRGGIFQGKKAQIRLNPSTAQTHPTGGSTGDMFVDANKRLWFCKGGTTWVQLA
jgi:hypothetical protein